EPRLDPRAAGADGTGGAGDRGAPHGAGHRAAAEPPRECGPGRGLRAPGAQAAARSGDGGAAPPSRCPDRVVGGVTRRLVVDLAYFARGLDRMREAQAAESWAREEFANLRFPVRELRDVRLGVFGLGGIGSAIARRALALGMPVAGVRRRPQQGGPPGVGWVGGRDDVPGLAAESG